MAQFEALKFIESRLAVVITFAVVAFSAALVASRIYSLLDCLEWRSVVYL
jgi:hypothetical protein